MADRIIGAIFAIGALAALFSFLAAAAAVMLEPDPDAAVKWFGAVMFGGLGLVAVAFLLELIRDALLAERKHERVPASESNDG